MMSSILKKNAEGCVHIKVPSGMEQRSSNALQRLLGVMPEVSPERLMIKFDSGLKEEIHDHIKDALRAWGGPGTWTVGNFGNVRVGPNERRSDVSFFRNKPAAPQRAFPLGSAAKGIAPVGAPILWLEVAFPGDRDAALYKITHEVQINDPNCATAIVVVPDEPTQTARDRMAYGAPAAPTIPAPAVVGGRPRSGAYVGYWPPRSNGPPPNATWVKVRRGQHVDIPIPGGPPHSFQLDFDLIVRAYRP
eukprot:m.480772 g.480772  ORF g.480772 m.480772 type:complete len:248 (+) comp54096_c0_seq1:283-1026(+)